MKRIALLTLLVAPLAACSITLGGADPSAPPAPAGRDADQAYLDRVRTFNPDMESATDASLLTLGHGTCDSLDDGVSFTDLINVGVEAGANGDEVAAVTVSAVQTLCPQYQNDLDTFLGN